MHFSYMNFKKLKDFLGFLKVTIANIIYQNDAKIEY